MKGKNLALILGVLALSLFLTGVISSTIVPDENYIAPCDLVEGSGEGEYDYVIVIREILRSDTTKSEAHSSIYNKNILPGNYEVTLVASDGYDERINVSQNYEQYYASFRKNSNEVARSNPTSDLNDRVAQVNLTQIVNDNLELPNGADEVKAFHYKYDYVPTTNYSANSVAAVCVGLKKIVEEPECGNGIVEDGEECDDGILNGIVPVVPYGQSRTYCATDCKIKTKTNYCGDGIRAHCYEECDDGNNVNGDGCSATCQNENPEEPENNKRNSATTLGFWECVPDWKCSGWSECSNGVTTRTCEDARDCEYKYNKPIESTKCVEPVLENTEVGNLNWLFVAGIILFILLAIILINLLR